MGAFVFSHSRPVKYLSYGNKIWMHPCKTSEEFKSTWENDMGSLPQWKKYMIDIGHMCYHRNDMTRIRG